MVGLPSILIDVVLFESSYSFISLISCSFNSFDSVSKLSSELDVESESESEHSESNNRKLIKRYLSHYLDQDHQNRHYFGYIKNISIIKHNQ